MQTKNLETLPHELIESIAQYSDAQGMLGLFLASKSMFSIDKLSRTRLFQRFLSHVVKGEEAAVLKLLNCAPSLLLMEASTEDYSGRTYPGLTGFQVALLCHDKELWQKMEPYFNKLPNGQEEKARQFHAIFPEGVPTTQISYNFDAIIQAITHSSEAHIREALEKMENDTPICQALRIFRQEFTSISHQEKFFNPQHLIAAFTAYDAKFDDWTPSQHTFFWRRVIGYTLRFLPTYYAQVFCNGLYDIVEENKPLVRTLEFISKPGVSYFDIDVPIMLGYDWAWCGTMGGLLSASGTKFLFQNLYSVNLSALLSLQKRVRASEQPASSCLSLPSCTLF